MNQLTYTLVAGTAKTYQVPSGARYWRIVAAPAGASLTLRFDNGDVCSAHAGVWGTSISPAKAINYIDITSDVAGDVTLGWALNQVIYDAPGVVGSGTALEVVSRPDIDAVVETAESSLVATTAADVSINVATGTPIYSVEVALDPAAPGAVRYSLDATAASATRGIWLNPGERHVCYITTRSVVGFRAISWYNPNPVAVNIETRSYTR